jgi:lipoprotein-anchoring transpeptidase ErfK/SrfK
MGDVQSNRIRKVLTTVALTGLLALAACSGTGEATWQNNGTPAKGAAAGAVAITAPANGATDVPAGTQIAYTASDTAQTDVVVTDAGGQKVAGGAGYDANTWVPDQALDYGKQYTVKVTSTGTDGKAATATTAFTTMSAPSKTIRFQSWYADHQVLGVAAPLVFKLSSPGVSSKADRAAVQKRLSVETTPKQDGSWYWFSNTELHYRSKDHWTPGTKINVDARTGGAPMGNGYFGRSDLTLDVSITTKPLTISIDDKTHMLTADLDGKVKKMPASLGKKATPSSSGNMVIMTRNTQETFDSSLGTGGTPVDAPGGYKVLVHWTMRLTWGGEFIHAAPWSVAQQGHSDASHGCTNLSTANAKWIYENSHVGDPVTVKNTGSALKWANGWTDWDVSWADYVKGSALPAA